jgi:hypothetical protein
LPDATEIHFHANDEQQEHQPDMGNLVDQPGRMPQQLPREHPDHYAADDIGKQGRQFHAVKQDGYQRGDDHCDTHRGDETELGSRIVAASDG